MFTGSEWYERKNEELKGWYMERQADERKQ